MNFNPNKIASIREVSDADIVEAMREIPGYLDITVEDFRTLYKIAGEHALTRVFANVDAESLMRSDIIPVTPDTALYQVAVSMAEQQLKTMPIVDKNRRVVGVVSEADFLKRLNATCLMEFMLRLMDNPDSFNHKCHETPVREAMSSPAVTIPKNAKFTEIAATFRHCTGRALPVVDADGRLSGLLLRKQFIAACTMEV